MTEKFVTPCQLPTPYEREILEILIEECAEVQQRATKMLRFGRDEVQPGQPDSNAERLSFEVGDVLQTLQLAEEAGLVNDECIVLGRERKRRQLAKFMQTSKARSQS